MTEILIYLVFSFTIFQILAKISYRLNLVDIPNERKIHSKATAYTGGIVISLIILFGLQFFEIFNILERKINVILSVAFLMSIIGLIDDKIQLNVGGKLSLQIFPIFYLITFEGLKLQQIGDYNYFQLNLGVFEVPFTIMCVLFLTNSFNYFDGLDGTLGISAISILAILFFLFIETNFMFLFIIIFVPLSIFLLFNFSFFKLPKMFLGNSGSLFLGFIMSFILIYFAELELVHPILIAWSISIFVFEFLSVNLIRLKNNGQIFKPGKDHLHHIIFFKTNSKFLTNIIISILNIVFFIIGYIIFNLKGPLISLISFIFLFIIFLLIRSKILDKHSIT